MKPLSKGGARRKRRKVKPCKKGLAQVRRRTWLADVAPEYLVKRSFTVDLVSVERRAMEKEAALSFQGTYRPRYPCEKDHIREVGVYEVAYRRDKGVVVQRDEKAGLLSSAFIEGLEGRGVFIVHLVFRHCGGERIDGVCGAVSCVNCAYTTQEVDRSYPFAALAVIVEDLGADPCQL